MDPWRWIPADGQANVPLVGHVPHDGTHIPSDVRSRLELDDEELSTEILRVTDHLTAELFSSIGTSGGVMHVNNISRLAVDPERFRNDADEIMASRGAGAVYRATSLGGQLRGLEFNEADREELLRRFFDPYAAAFEDLVTRALARSERCLIIDCHSFPLVPLEWELHPEAERPPICIGTDERHTPADLVGLLKKVCETKGRRILVDVPFRGTYTPIRYWQRDARVSSVMIEVRRDTYIDETTGRHGEGFEETRAVVESMVDACIEWIGG